MSAKPSEVTKLHKSIVSVLKTRGNPEIAVAQEKYMKGVLSFYGIKAPEARILYRELKPLWENCDIEIQIALSWKLLESSFFEEKDLAVCILAKCLKKCSQNLDISWMHELESRFASIVTGWATCDSLCSQVFRPMLTNKSLRKKIVSWKSAENPWLQRASCVSFVNEARHGNYTDDILKVCHSTILNSHRFVQLGTGWVLRELSLVDIEIVTDFILQHKSRFIAEGLRYAVEKFPVDRKKSLLNALKP